jgi:hypothetical protein
MKSAGIKGVVAGVGAGAIVVAGVVTGGTVLAVAIAAGVVTGLGIDYAVDANQKSDEDRSLLGKFCEITGIQKSRDEDVEPISDDIVKLQKTTAYENCQLTGSRISDDFKNQEGGFLSKFIAGAFGFIKGAISFIITDFLDLIKSAVSWIIEKIFGKDNPVTKFLDSFSFTELFVKGIDIIRDFFLGIPKYFTDAFKMGGGVFGALGILVDDIIDSVKNIFGFLGEILGKFGDYVLSKIPEPIKKLFGIGTSGGDSLDQAGADLTSPTGTPSASAPAATKVQPSQEAGGARVTLPSGKISVGGNKGTVTNADGVTRDLTKDEIADVRMPEEARDSDKDLLAKKEMYQSTIDNGDDSYMSREKTIRAKREIRQIDKEIKIRADLLKQESPKKIGNGTIGTALNPPMMLRSSGNVSSPELMGNEGSAVNQGQALGVGTANLNDAKSKQKTSAPMMLSNSPNNSQTSNSNVSNNYTSSNVTAWDRYDPFANQMPSNAAK